MNTPIDASPDFYKALVEHSLEIITVLASDGTIKYESPSVTRILGYDPQELIGTNSFSMVHPDDQDRVKKEFALGLAAPGQTKAVVMRAKHKDGSWRYMESHAWFLPFDTNIQGIIATSRDVSHRIALESRLETLSHAVEQSPAAVVITDTKGTIQYVNPKFTEVTGYTSKEAVGQNPRILKSGFVPLEVYKELWDAITKGGVWHGELINKKKNGELYTEYASISGVVNDKGEVIHYLAVKEDITKRKKTEDDMRRTLSRLETIVKNAPVVVWTLDKNGIFTLSQGKGLAGLGLQESEVVGKNVDDVYADVPQILEEKKRVLGGETIKSVIAVRGRVFETFQSPVKNAAGDIDGMSGIAVDITEQKKIEEALKAKSEEAMRFNELTVDRELKMVELKKEIEELKKKLA